MDEFMEGRSELGLPVIDDIVRLEDGKHGHQRIRLGEGKSVTFTMGDGAEDVLRRLLKANVDRELEHLAKRIVEARSHELQYAKPGRVITLDDLWFGQDLPLPGLPVSLCVNDHTDQCDCGVEIDVHLDWTGRWSGRQGGLRWTEANRKDDLRDVLRELLNSCSPMIIDAIIDGVIEAKHAESEDKIRGAE